MDLNKFYACRRHIDNYARDSFVTIKDNYMKRFLSVFWLILFSATLNACPVCEKQQPKVLRGITHGTGPDSQWDYIIVSLAIAVVLFTLFYSLKWIFSPGEKSDDHIKQIIFNAD